MGKLTGGLIQLLVVIMAAALLLAACGGDGDDDAGSTGTAEPTATSDQAGEGDSDAGETPEPTRAPAGEDGGDAEPGAALDACSLLTDGEVESVLGAPADPTPEDFPPIYSCRWETQDATSPALVSVSVYSGTREEATAYYDATSSTEGIEPVEGLGDRANWSPAPFNELEVLDGNYDVAVSVTYGGEEAKAFSEKIARQVLTRLP